MKLARDPVSNNVKTDLCRKPPRDGKNRDERIEVATIADGLDRRSYRKAVGQVVLK